DQILADDYVRSHGMRATDVMTSEVISVPEDAPLLKIVELMAKNHIRRVVVRDGNRPVGMISRADVLRAVDEIEQTRQSTDRDREIRTLLLTELRKQPWFRLQDQDVAVSGGVVTYRGVVGTPSEQAALRVAAEAVPGVVRVMDLTLAESDTTLF
ncbi:MAG: CBS domain-containing protein, partial [Rhizobiales bacterium]|nr:CBS domain-containing protein [Hyphomicrobiales bacterium]